jgi:glycerol-3-phosphate dehydrogenase
MDASKVVDLTLLRMGGQKVRSVTGDRPLPWAPKGSYRSWLRESLIEGLELGLDEETISNCQQRYGTNIRHLYEIVAGAPSLSGRIVPDAPFCLAEIVHAARHEMVRGLQDLLRRRIPLLLINRLAPETVKLTAGLLGPALGWSEERQKREIEALLQEEGS